MGGLGEKIIEKSMIWRYCGDLECVITFMHLKKVEMREKSG